MLSAEPDQRPLAVRLIDKGVVYPTIRVASRPGQLLMGVYDEEGAYVDDTALNRRAGEQGAPVPPDLFPVVTAADEAQAIYAGPLYFHFGHFLLESLARAWYASRYPEVPLAWAGQHDWQGIELRPWQREILDLLQITNPVRIVADPTRFDLLHVPDLGYRYDDRFHPEHAEFLGRYPGPAQVAGHRLWLSRSRVESEVRDLNAEPTERRLAEAGWTIAHPETLSVREQLDELSRAEVVAGEEGSAFHALVLLEDVASKRFHILRRHGPEHRNLHTIGDVRRVDQTFSTVGEQVVLSAQGRVVSKVSPSSSEILDLLEVPVPAARPGTTDWADQVLERALEGLGPQRLLDVGATSARLVVGSTAAVRVAVSERFDFDPRAFAGSGIDFYELGLDRYADLFHSERGPFDAIRINGSRLGQVLERFRVSTQLSDDDTVWILGCGNLAARAALAVPVLHPGYVARRLLVRRKFVFVVRRVPGEPTDAVGLAELSAAEVRRRARRIRPAGLRGLRRGGLPPEGR